MRLRRLLIIPATATLAVCGLALAARGTAESDVKVEPVMLRGLYATAVGNGQLRASRRADVESETGGRVTKLYVHEGSVVQAGDPLAQVDRSHGEMAVAKTLATLSQARAAAAQVHANLVQSETGLHRAEEIAASTGLLAAAELEQSRTSAKALEASYDAAQAAVRASEVAVDDARAALVSTTIVAPIGGTVTRVRVRVGETLGGGATPSATVATIADLSTIDAVINLGETDLPRVHVGDSVSIRVEAFGKARLTGRVDRIGAVSLGNAATRQSALYEVTVSLAPTTRVLVPDMSVTGEIVTDRRTGIVGVPLLAIVMRDYDGRITVSGQGKGSVKGDAAKGLSRRTAVEGVFLARDGRAEFRAVRTGIMGDQYVEILQGLRPGERVVVGSYRALRELENGMEVPDDATTDAKAMAARS